MRKRVGYKQVATDEVEDEPMTADKVAEANGMVYSDGIWVKPGIEAALRNQKMDYKKARENVLKATLQRELEECKERERRTEIASWEQIKCGLIVFVIVILFIVGVVMSLPHDFHHHYAASSAKYNKHKADILEHVGNAYNHYKKSRRL